MRLTVLLATALTLVALPAHATPKPVPDPVNGCGYDFWQQHPTDPALVQSVLYGAVAVADLPSEAFPAGANPVDVTLTCTVQAAGQYWHGAPDEQVFTASGSAVAVVPPTYFTTGKPGEFESIALCSRADVTTSNGDTYTFWSNSQNSMWRTDEWGTCDGAPQCLALGSNCVWYLAVLEEVWAMTGAGDSHVCPVLAARSPGVPGVVDVDPTGDTYVAGQFFWDCPPYQF